MSNHIFHIASPIALSMHETIVHLEDFIIDCSCIKTITPPSGIIMWESKQQSLLKLEVEDAKKLDFVSALHIEFTDNTSADILLIKSKRLDFTFRYEPHYHASTVQIAGDFNSWNPQGYNLSWRNDAWELDMEIDPGNYSYQLIKDGNWINDPHNHEVIDNGYGGYNSLLRVPFPNKQDSLHLYTERVLDLNIIIKIEGHICGYIALWQNQDITGKLAFTFGNRIMITIPEESKKLKRSFIRLYAYSDTAVANDILIPLEYGKIVSSTSSLTRDDKEAQSMYFILLDRFNNGNRANDSAIIDPDIHPKMNFQGGDIVGVTKKLSDGYLSDLGINTLWISPVVKNPESYVQKNNEKLVGYHGYWPIDSEAIDPRFGTEDDLRKMLSEAHSKGVNVIVDYVANHVFKDNSIIKENPDWCTTLYLEDGSLNIGRWEEQRFTTWFDEFLPTLDFDKPEVLEKMTDIAVGWIQKFGFDGFRHDACKHISSTFWRRLTKKLKEKVMIPQQKRLYQIGETFGGREMLQTYINSGVHDGQFSFNLYYELRAAFLYEDSHFDKLVTSIQQDLASFGSHHLMGNITGNHDMPRFISYAGEDLCMNQNAEHEGWNRHITVKNPVGYKKLQLLMACITTLPGIPVIFYGDEYGMPGAGDPDNRRFMKFNGLNPEEEETLLNTQTLLKIRNNCLALLYGDFEVLHTNTAQLVYARSYFDSAAIIVFNKSSKEENVSFTLPDFYAAKQYEILNDIPFEQNGKEITMLMPAHSYQIISSEGKKEKSAFHKNENTYYNR